MKFFGILSVIFILFITACSRLLIVDSVNYTPQETDKSNFVVAIDDSNFIQKKKEDLDKKKDVIANGTLAAPIYGQFSREVLEDIKKVYENHFTKVVLVKNRQEAIDQKADFYVETAFDRHWDYYTLSDGRQFKYNYVKIIFWGKIYDPVSQRLILQHSYSSEKISFNVGFFFVSLIPMSATLGLAAQPLASLELPSMEKKIKKAMRKELNTLDTDFLNQATILQYPLYRDQFLAIEKKGDDAARKSQIITAMAYYKKAMEENIFFDLEGFYGKRIIEKYINLIAKVKKLPAIPLEAERLMIMGQTKFKDQQFASAIIEMKKAIRTAPWWAEAYYNLGLTYEGAKQYKLAARFLQYYIKINPKDKEADKIRRHSYELEAKIN